MTSKDWLDFAEKAFNDGAEYSMFLGLLWWAEESYYE